MTSSRHDLLVFSDVHLGRDLVQCVRPEIPEQRPATDRRDQELAALLDWYRLRARADRSWRLVIAGDLVDFVGMSVAPPTDAGLEPPDAEDLELGLGGAEDHAVYKLRKVARRHALVFEALARFVGAGNELVLVRGNHDIDFHWPRVQDEFRRQLAAHSPLGPGAVVFSPWFYYEEGRVFVEHGHQYDVYCSCEHLLHPLSPGNPRRSSRSLSDLLLRHVVRPTRGMLETGHEQAGVLDYLAFAARLGVGGMLRLAARFATAVRRLLSTWREHFSEGAERIRAHHDRRMTELAQLLDVSIDRLRALARLQRPPLTRSFASLALAVMLDRVALGVASAVAFAVGWLLLPTFGDALRVLLVACVTTVVASVVLSRMRDRVDPSLDLRDSAVRVAGLFPAAFVVMGHTHLPEVSPSADRTTTYVNLGAWDDTDDGEHPAGAAVSRTHLVVEEGDDGSAHAELRVWEGERGPRRLFPGAPPGRD